MHERTCAGWRYCVECRGRRANKAREKIRPAREHWLKHAKRFERERFLTATMPHAAGVAADVRTCLDTWERFGRGVRRWVTKRYSEPRFAFVRALEVTPSDGGHVHVHAWVGSPYLPQHVLTIIWGRALTAEPGSGGYVPVCHVSKVLATLKDERSRAEFLRAAGWRGKPACDGTCNGWRTVERGRPRKDGTRRCYLTPCTRRHYVPEVVVHIEVAKANVENELIKYLIKDIDDAGLVDPLLAANLIEATEGVRVVAASRGFWVLEFKCCPHCDAPAQYLVLRVDQAQHDVERERGPPA